MEGHYFTWFKSLGIDRAVEEKLDRVMVNGSWLSLFQDANVHCLSATTSDHYPILLWCDKFVKPSRNQSGFLFENSWLLEPGFDELVRDNWLSSDSIPLLDKLRKNGDMLQQWSSSNFHKVGKDIESIHRKIEHTRNNIGQDNINYFTALKRRLNYLLVKEDT